MQSIISNPYIQNNNSDIKDPSGFLDSDNIVVSYDTTERKVTLTHSSGYIYYLWRGVKKRLVSPWISDAHIDSNNTYFLSSTDGNNFTWKTTLWNFYDLQVSYVYFSTNHKIGFREVHGIMPWQVHQELHQTLGTYKISGGDISDIIPSSTVATNRRPLVSNCIIKDEDLQTSVNAISNETNAYTILNLSGASNGTVEFTKASADIVPLNGNQPYYNQLSGGNYVQTLMSNNSYMNIWLIAVPVTNDIGSQAYRFLWLQGQTMSSVLSTIQQENTRGLSLGNLQSLFAEFVFVAKVVIRYQSSNWHIVETTLLSGTQYNQVNSSFTGMTSVNVDESFFTGNGTVANPLSIGNRVTLQTSASLNLTSIHDIINCDCTSNSITLNLPQISTISVGKEYIIHKLDASINNIIIDGYSNETINGYTTINVAFQRSTMNIKNIGTEWIIT